MENRRKNFLIPLMLLLSHLLGLLRVILVSYKFGSTTDADLLSYAFSYPNQARKKIEEGTDNLALIRKLGAERNSESVSFFILLFHFAALFLLCMLSFPISNLLFRFSSFTKEAVEKGSYLILTFLCFIVLFSYGSNLNAYLQISGKKLSSTVLSSVPSFFSIVFLFLFSENIGVYSFSLGLLTGGIAYFLISFIYALRCGMRIKFTLDFDVSFAKSYLVSVFLVLISVVEILPLFLSSSFISKGSIYFSNAYSILLMPNIFIIELFTIVIYPELSRLNERERSRKALDALYQLSFISLSIFLLLFSFSNEISYFLFFGGKYTHEDAMNTAALLRLASPSVYFLSIFSFFQRMMFLSLKGKKIIASSILKIALSYLLLFILNDTIFKSSYILLLTSAFIFLFMLLSSKNVKKEVNLIFKSAIASIPLILLTVLKLRLDFSSFIENKLVLLIVSLASGALAFLLSAVIFMKVGKRLQN